MFKLQRERVEHAIHVMVDSHPPARPIGDIADALPALVAYVGPDLRYRYVNKPYEQWFGRSRDQLVGHTVEEVLGPELYAAAGPRARAALAGEPQRFEAMARGPDGARRPIEAQYLPDIDANGAVIGYHTLILDRSFSYDRDRRMVDIIDGFGAGFWSVDTGWRVTYCNAVAARFIGRTREEFIGRAIWDVMSIRGTPFESVLHRVMATRKPEDLEVLSALRPIQLAVRVYPIEGGVAVSFRDITAAVAAQAKILESEARFRAMADSAPAPVWVTSAAGELEFINQTFMDYTGRKAGGLLGDLWLTLLHPDDAPNVMAQRAAARAGPDPYTFEARFRRYDAEWRWMRASAKPRFDVHGAFQGYVGMAVDITETRAAEIRQQLLIHELNHRVKNSLATVQSLAHQTLRDGVITREARDLFTDRLLALSAVHNVLTRDNWVGAELQAVAAEALSPYNDPGAPRITLEGPRVRVAPNVALALSMALHELATNAIKYGALSVPEGKLSLDWSLDADGQAATLRWRETGGPAVTAPKGRGFGSRLLTQGLMADLGAPALITWDQAGVICVLRAPVGGETG